MIGDVYAERVEKTGKSGKIEIVMNNRDQKSYP